MKALDRAAELSARRERLLLVVSEQRLQLAQQLVPIYRGASTLDRRIATVRNFASNPLVLGAVGLALLRFGPRLTFRLIGRGARFLLVARSWLPFVSTMLNRRP